MIRVVCGCGRVFKAEQRHSGKRTRCPVCGANLVIGQTPASSSDGDLDEVPSWWYPSDPRDPFSDDESAPAENGDPELVRTAVLPAVSAPGIAAERGPAVGQPAPPDGPAPMAQPGRSGRRIWILAGALAAVATALILGAGSCMRANVTGRGDSTEAHAPPAIPTGPFERAGRRDGPADGGRPPRMARRLRLLVPAYIYPTGEGRKQWGRLMDAAARVDLVVIVNPDTGPGLERNPDYAAAIAEAASRGVKLVGYISTQYAQRQVSEVKGDIDAWVRYYPRIAGFFLDQQPREARFAPYFAEIGAHARSKLRDATVITNPGVPCDDSYLARRATDLVCVFANFEGYGPFELPANLKEYGPSHFAALVYQVPDAEAMRAMLKEAIIKRIGYFYATDGKQAKPWGQLPAYWEAEVEALTHLQ